VLDPSPTMVQGLVGAFLFQRQLLATGVFVSMRISTCGSVEGQAAQILQ
jgi:hypothetical protein